MAIAAVAVISFNGCNKDYDTKDPDEKDGKITFYTTSSNCGSIEIELNGENVGPLTSVYTGSSAPDCGTTNTLTIEPDIGAHDYHAADDCNHIWEGTVIINKGDCKVNLLSR